MDVDAELSLLPGTDGFATTTDRENEDLLCADAEEPEPAPAFRLTHKRTLSPAPAAEPELIFQALRPAVNGAPVSGRPVFPSLAHARIAFICDADRSLSSRTFGSARSTSGSRGSLGTSPVYKKAKGRRRKESSLMSSECAQSRCDVDVAGSIGSDSMGLPILHYA
jgi:serine/arginine repetitive matrix protein 2